MEAVEFLQKELMRQSIRRILVEGLLEPSKIGTWQAHDMYVGTRHTRQLWRPWYEDTRLHLHCLDADTEPDPFAPELLDLHPFRPPQSVLVLDGGRYRTAAGVILAKPRRTQTLIVSEHLIANGLVYYETPHGEDIWHADAAIGDPAYSIRITRLRQQQPFPSDSVVSLLSHANTRFLASRMLHCLRDTRLHDF